MFFKLTDWILCSHVCCCHRNARINWFCFVVIKMPFKLMKTWDGRVRRFWLMTLKHFSSFWEPVLVTEALDCEKETRQFLQKLAETCACLWRERVVFFLQLINEFRFIFCLRNFPSANVLSSFLSKSFRFIRGHQHVLWWSKMFSLTVRTQWEADNQIAGSWQCSFGVRYLSQK